MKKNTLKQYLLELNKCLKNEKINLNDNDTYSYYDGMQVSKKLWQLDAYRKLVSSIIEDDFINSRTSLKYMEHILMSIINRIYDSENPSETVIEETTKFFQFLNELSDYEIFVPLRDISLEIEEIVFCKNVKVLKSDERLIHSIIVKPEKITIGSQNPIPFGGRVKPISYRAGTDKEFYSCIGSAVIQVIVKACDPIKAVQIALNISRLVVCFLKYLDWHIWDTENLSLRVPGYGLDNENLLVIVKNNDKVLVWDENYESEEYEIDALTQKYIVNLGGQRFGELLEKQLSGELNEIEQSVMQSLIIFGESRNEQNNNLRFLKLMLSIEYLLNTSSVEPIVSTICDRIAFMFGEHLDERICIAEDVKKQYNKRSRVVHHGKSEIGLQELDKLERYAIGIIHKFLCEDEWKSISNKKDLNKKFNEIKFS
jgi:hypothetical protein